jgi:Na+-translocating ferredoxin:NAD+ oxidoreductase subunit D
MDNTQLSVSFRPFRYSGLRFSHTNAIMVLLLLPAFVHGITLYGEFAVRVVALSIVFSMLADVACEKLFGRPTRIADGSTILTGMLLGMILPPLTPWWLLLFTAGTSIFLGKQLFGGAGGSPFNAVCIGWAVVMVSWPELVNPTYGSVSFDLPFSTAYPLAEVRRLGADAFESFSIGSLFLGKQTGCIGSGSPVLLLAGGIAGVLLGIIPWIIPFSFIAVLMACTALASAAGLSVAGWQFHLVTGFSMIGAFFLAADVSSRPVSYKVMVWYGAATGALTLVFRLWSVFPEGLPFALLIVNCTVPLLDRGKPPKQKTRPEVCRL